MHPSEMSTFRKWVIALFGIAFTGALMVYTGMANLDLLKSVYPNPQFYMFGLFALEGGVIFWTAYFLLHKSGKHKALAVVALGVDMLMSCSGFVLETENVTNQANALPLPSVLILIAFAVVFNVSMAMICHLVPSPEEIPGPYQPRTIVESEGPGSAKQLAAGVVAPLMERGQAYLQAREDFRKASHQAARKLVGDYLEEHPDASIEEIRKETKLSRQTIIDHRREILGQ